MYTLRRQRSAEKTANATKLQCWLPWAAGEIEALYRRCWGPGWPARPAKECMEPRPEPRPAGGPLTVEEIGEGVFACEVKGVQGL